MGSRITVSMLSSRTGVRQVKIFDFHETEQSVIRTAAKKLR